MAELPPDLEGFRRAVRLRDRCRNAALAKAADLDVPLTFVQANVVYDVIVDLIRADERERATEALAARIEADCPDPVWHGDCAHKAFAAMAREGAGGG